MRKPPDIVAQLAKHFREDFCRRVVVRRRVMPNYGYAKKTPKGFNIYLNSTLCEGGQIAILIHEWSHIESWDSDVDPSQHGTMFGIAYSQVWQSYLRFCGDSW